jgi:hypothetical protein
VLIASAAAEIPVKGVADLLLGRFWVAQQQLVCGEDHSRGAKTALKPVTLPKGFLNRMECIPLSQTFDRQDITAIRLHRKHRTGLDRAVIQHNRARAANAGFTANVSAREPDRIPKKMNQQQPRFHFAGMLDPVYTERNFPSWERVH